MHNPRLSKIAAMTLMIVGATALTSSVYAAKKSYKGEYVETTTVVATPVTVPAPSLVLRSGPYVGVGLGYDTYTIKQNLNVRDEDNDVFTMNPPLSGRSFVGGIFAGYGQYFDNFYLGAEALFNMSDAKASYSMGGDALYTASVTARNSYGINLVPGVKLTNATLLYAKVGYIRTNFKAEEVNTIASAPSNNFSVSTNKVRTGTNYGIGLESLVTDKVGIRGEYNYTKYNSFTTATGNKFSPSNNEFMLGLVYHIA